MLSRLVIHDVVLIEKLALPLERGLNVFTGETGAGKSILLDALGLALGGRSDAGLVRAGAAQASVAAEFSLDENHPLFAMADEQGLKVENPVILRRVIGKDGKSRAFFNDQPIGVGLLKQLGETLIEIHGQFETHGLLNAATHRGLLDAFGGLEATRSKLSTVYATWKQATDAWKNAKELGERARAEEDYLRASVQELEDLAPATDEAEDLAAKRTELQHREKILEALTTASQALDGEKGALAALTLAGKAVARISDKAVGLSEILAGIDRSANESSEASQLLSKFLSSLDNDPRALQRIEERLFALRAAARKYNTTPEGLPETLTELSGRLALLTNEGGHLAKLASAVATTRKAYVEIAKDLSSKRRSASEKFEKLIGKELSPLKLERAKFVIDVTSLPEEQWNSDGADRVTFLAATNPGTEPGPLQKIASGGELARFMLALKTVLAAADPVPVLVFDEVDTGIGGAVASAVGERLAHLAQHVQILVVTHSPQVAARGEHHLRVAKRVAGKTTFTDVSALTPVERREEIARMLAGAHVTDAARQAADSLMDEQLAPRTKKRA